MDPSVQLLERLKIQLARMVMKAEKLGRRVDAPWLPEFVEAQKAALARLDEHLTEMTAKGGGGASGAADAMALRAKRIQRVSRTSSAGEE